MSQTKNHCKTLIAVWLRPSTTESCICCKQVAEKPRGEHLKMLYVCSSRIVKCSLICTRFLDFSFEFNNNNNNDNNNRPTA